LALVILILPFRPQLQASIRQLTLKTLSLYNPKPSQVNVIDRHKYVIALEINGLRGIVLSGHNYWERLLINLAISEPGKGKAIVEGFYASGTGDSPPATSAYESMEKDYLPDLSRFTKRTFANLQQ
jgi:hypothetical protein